MRFCRTWETGKLHKRGILMAEKLWWEGEGGPLGVDAEAMATAFPGVSAPPARSEEAPAVRKKVDGRVVRKAQLRLAREKAKAEARERAAVERAGKVEVARAERLAALEGSSEVREPSFSATERKASGVATEADGGVPGVEEAEVTAADLDAAASRRFEVPEGSGVVEEVHALGVRTLEGGEVIVTLPGLHPAQAQIRGEAKRYNVLMCGRSFGKTLLGLRLVAEGLLRGEQWAWCAPTYKILDGAWQELVQLLQGAPGFTKNEQKLRITVGNTGVLEGWSLDTEDPGRSRRYHGMVIDEGGLVKGLLKLWNGSLRPTLMRHQGVLWVFGTPKKKGDFTLMHGRGVAKEPGWAAWNKGSWDNPYIPAEEIEESRRTLPPDDFKREVMGLPVDDGSNPFGFDAIEACQRTPELVGEPVVWAWDLARAMDWTVGYGLDAMAHVVAEARWQGLPWGETIQRIMDLTGDTPAYGDATGLGDPIIERLIELGVDITPFIFSQKSKQSLMQRLAAAIQMGEVSFAPAATAETPLVSELESFTYTFTDTGTRYSAPSGAHDDCVMALALALYGFDRIRPSVKAMPLLGSGAPRDTTRWQQQAGVEDDENVSDAKVLSVEDVWQDRFGDGWG